MLWRLILGWKDGFMTMFKPPMGRMSATRRSPASALRFFLFEQTKYGYYMDVTQAVFSAISCIMFIAVAYSAYDPDSVQVCPAKTWQADDGSAAGTGRLPPRGSWTALPAAAPAPAHCLTTPPHPSAGH